MNKILYAAITTALMTFFIFAFTANADDLLQLSAKPDNTSPTIDHTPVKNVNKLNTPALISAIVKDFESGVKQVILKYRRKGEFNYNFAYMKRSAQNRDFFHAFIPKQYITQQGVEYFIEARDVANNVSLKGISFSPISMTVASNTSSPITTITPNKARNTNIVEVKTPMKDLTKKQASKKNNWIWWTAGILAGGFAIASMTEKDGGTDEGTVIISAPRP